MTSTIVYRSNGGSDALENRILVHPNCHAQIHTQNGGRNDPSTSMLARS